MDPGTRSLFPVLSPLGSLLSFRGVSELSPPLTPSRAEAGLDRLGNQALEHSLSFRPSPLQTDVS